MEHYKPKNKKEREARRKVWERYQAMRDDPLRKEAEAEWELGDKAFMQWMPPREDGDWRSHLALPDSFAGVQTYLQETIDRKSRPTLNSVESSDLAIEMFVNSIMKYSMDRTGYDYQVFLAKQAAAIRGTAWLFEFYRYEKRDIQDPVSVNEDGSLKYVKKEVIDHDDTYTTFVENEYVFVDPNATCIGMARDQILREIVLYDEFQRVYSKKSDFMNVNLVKKMGNITENTSFFEKPKDMTDDDVEILHYFNRSTDEYLVLANDVLIRIGAMPFKHKELPGTPVTHYNIPGRIWGMGIPKVVFSLTEERKSLRNTFMDRQNLQLNKMFLVNDLVDLDDEDFRTRPNGFIPVNANGLPLEQVIKSVEYGDVSASYYKADGMLLEDVRRAHGIDDRLQAPPQGGTATQAAMAQQSSQRRIALINTLSEMDTFIRVGRLKWSNIQFFYPAPRVERITEDNNTRTKKVYRRIKTENQEFKIVEDDGSLKLQFSEIDGSSGFRLDKTHARFMDGDFDTVVSAEPSSLMSKPIRQAKITEMVNVLALNPQFASQLDPAKTVKRFLKINDEDPKDWLMGNGMTDTDWRRYAIHENQVMAAGQPIAPTKDAPESHTEEHLNFMNSAGYRDLIQENPAIEQIFEEHVFGEHENNPKTGSMADLMGGAGGGQPAAPGGAPPEVQMNDLQPSNMVGADQRDTQQESL